MSTRQKSLAVLVLLCFCTVGCTGSFNMTRKVYNFHRSQDDKWMDEIFFLGCILLPIYGISTFADAIVFNSIEFWTGDNPIDMAGTEPKVKQVKVGQSEATLSYNPQTDLITITSPGNPSITLKRGESGILAKDQNGKTLYSSFQNPSGEIMVYNKDLNLVKKYSTQELALLKEKYTK